MDMFIIAAWKALYRHTLLQNLILNMETREQRKCLAIANKVKAGLKGLTEGHDLHMLDVSKLFVCSRDTVCEETIAWFWMKASILPFGIQANLMNKHGKVRASCKSIDEKCWVT